MSCKHCKTAYDHSIHKPYSSCSHTFCYNCIITFLICPDCNETIDKKHPNLALLEFIPKSESEKLKEELLDDLNILLQEISRSNLRENMSSNLDKMKTIKKTIIIETNELIKSIQMEKDKIISNIVSIEQDASKVADYVEQINDLKSLLEKNHFSEEKLNLHKNKAAELRTCISNSFTLIDKFDDKQFILKKDVILKEGSIFEVKTNQMLYDEYIQKGKESIKRKFFEDALTYFDKSIALFPNDVLAHFQKGKLFHKIKEFLKAIECYEKCIQLNPSGSLFYVLKALSLIELKQFQSVIALAEKAIDLSLKQDKICAQAYECKGEALTNLNRNEEALVAFDKAIEISPESVKSYNFKGVILDKLNQFDKAVECYNKCIDYTFCTKSLKFFKYSNAEKAEFFYNKSVSLFVLTKYHDSIESLNKALDLNSNYYAAYCLKGEVLARINKFDEAIVFLNKAIELFPNLARAYNEKGIMYSLNNEDKKAIECLDICIGINPIESFYYLNKGRCLLNLKKHAQAIQVLDICLLLDKKNADAFLYRGEGYIGLGEYSNAISSFDKAIELEPSNQLFKYLKSTKLKKYEQEILIQTKKKRRPNNNIN